MDYQAILDRHFDKVAKEKKHIESSVNIMEQAAINAMKEVERVTKRKNKPDYKINPYEPTGFKAINSKTKKS